MCGMNHVIMVDINHRIWICGSNYEQMGDALPENVNEPKEMIMFKDCIIDEIKSSSFHVYLKCKGDEHHLWGNIVINNAWLNP